MTRPYVQVRPWEWRDPDGSATPGVALFQGRTVRAHLTPDEARAWADQLHDHADQAEQEAN